MSLPLKLAFWGFVIFSLSGLLYIFYRPLSLRLKDINPSGLTIHPDAIYLNGERMPVVEPASFEELSMGYSRDGHHVYFLPSLLEGASPISFRKINDDPNDHGFRDDERVYVGGRYVPIADAETFRRIDGQIFIDKSFVYYMEVPVKEVDTASFKYLGLKYGKDKHNVYLFGSQGGVDDGQVKVLKDADAASFDVIPGATGITMSVPTKEMTQTPDAEDKDHLFLNGRILKEKN